MSALTDKAMALIERLEKEGAITLKVADLIAGAELVTAGRVEVWDGIDGEIVIQLLEAAR